MKVKVLAVVLFGTALTVGCAGIKSTPVATTSSATHDTGSKDKAKAEQELAAAAAKADKQGAATTPTSDTATVAPESESADEDAAGAEAADAGEPEPAEEIEPSPLDEIPDNVPAASADALSREKQLVASAPVGFDIPMVLNDQVAAYIDYFTSRGRHILEASLVRSGQFVDLFQRVFEEAGIPKDLVYMAHVESAFKTNAYSRAKAKGMFQFISSTGRRYGLRVDGWIDERSDPERSARAAALYLKDLYGMFGDWYLALAAYNAGEGKIQRSLATTRKSDFWSLAQTRSLRRETRNYVPAILAATLIAKDPKKFGFDVDMNDPVPVDAVAIDGQTDLRVIARIVDVDPEALKALNPHLRRGVTAPSGVTTIYVPRGLGDETRVAYAALPVADRMVVARHQVGAGESLASIAHRYGVTTASLQRANGLGKSTTIHAGQEIVVPVIASPAPDADGIRYSAVSYRVRHGDTLGLIARRYRTSPTAIAKASGITVHTPIRVGQRLRIPANRRVVPATVAQTSHRPSAATADGGAGGASTLVHTVRRGETLYRIAGLYQVTVDEICALNNITPSGTLYPGKRLTIRSR